MKDKTEKHLRKHLTELEKINIELWEAVRGTNDKFTSDYMNFFIMLVQNINQHTAKLSIDENDWPTIAEVKK